MLISVALWSVATSSAISASFSGLNLRLIVHVAEGTLIVLSRLLRTHSIIKFAGQSFKFNRKLCNTIRVITSSVINAIEVMMKRSFLFVISAIFIAVMFTAILH